MFDATFDLYAPRYTYLHAGMDGPTVHPYIVHGWNIVNGLMEVEITYRDSDLVSYRGWAFFDEDATATILDDIEVVKNACDLCTYAASRYVLSRIHYDVNFIH